MLAGCGADSSTEPEAKATASASPTDDAPEVTSAPPAAPKQAASCDWKSPKIAGSTSNLPKATAGALDAALIGAWQHTHIDTGAGFKPVGVGKDIVLPAPASGYTVRSWDENTMVWVNNRNKKEVYLLKRR